MPRIWTLTHAEYTMNLHFTSKCTHLYSYLYFNIPPDSSSTFRDTSPRVLLLYPNGEQQLPGPSCLINYLLILETLLRDWQIPAWCTQIIESTGSKRLNPMHSVFCFRYRDLKCVELHADPLVVRVRLQRPGRGADQSRWVAWKRTRITIHRCCGWWVEIWVLSTELCP